MKLVTLRYARKRRSLGRRGHRSCPGFSLPEGMFYVLVMLMLTKFEFIVRVKTMISWMYVDISRPVVLDGVPWEDCLPEVCDPDCGMACPCLDERDVPQAKLPEAYSIVLNVDHRA